MPIPVLVKHCALAIYKDSYLTSHGPGRVQDAFNIAVSRLMEYGFLWRNAGRVTPDKIRLTGKGLKAEARHQRERGGKTKTKEWDGLYRLIQEEVAEDEGSGAMSEDAGSSTVENRESRSQQKRRRLASAARSAPRRNPKRVSRVKKAKNARRR